MISAYCQRHKNVFYASDATAYGIIRDSNNLKDFSSGARTHIVIPDLLPCLNRKRETVATFTMFLNSVIEEGIVRISSYATKYHSDQAVSVKAGLITALPIDAMTKKRAYWTRIGFLSRALPVSYDYKSSTQIEIRQCIKDQQHIGWAPKNLELPTTKKIHLPSQAANAIEPYAVALGNMSNVYGFRYQRQLQTLAKALALLQGKDEVDKETFEEFKTLMDFVNLEYMKI